MQCVNIASRTNGAGCMYIRNTYVPNIHIIYICRQFSVFTTSVGLAALAPITDCIAMAVINTHVVGVVVHCI